MEIFSVIGYVLVLIGMGCYPVISKVMKNQKPSPYGHSWAPIVSPETQILGMTETLMSVKTDLEMEQDLSYLADPVNQISIQPEIPIYSADQVYEDELQNVQEMLHSIPTDDMFENIKQLVGACGDVMEEDNNSNYFQFESEGVNITSHFENVQADDENQDKSPLTKREFDSITKKYGRDIARIITATPSMSISPGTHQVMMGRITIEEDESVFLNFREDKVKLSGSVPKYEQEVMIVKGHFIKEGNFRVMSWEDAETLAYMNHHLYDNESSNEQAAVM